MTKGALAIFEKERYMAAKRGTHMLGKLWLYCNRVWL